MSSTPERCEFCGADDVELYGYCSPGGGSWRWFTAPTRATIMSPDQRDELETAYLRALMKLDAAAWRRAMYHDDAGAPIEPLTAEQRQIVREVRRVRHRQRREEAS